MKQNSIFSLLWVVLIFSNFVIGQVDNERKNVVLYIAEFSSFLPNGAPTSSQVAYYEKSDFISLIDDTLLQDNMILKKGVIVPDISFAFNHLLLIDKSIGVKDHRKFYSKLSKMNSMSKFICSMKDANGNSVNIFAVVIVADIIFVPATESKYELNNMYIKYKKNENRNYMLIKKIHKCRRFRK